MTYFDIEDRDKVIKKSSVKQLIDVLQIDIAGKDDNNLDLNTRKKYEVFTTGSSSSNATIVSSLFHTVFDQDHTFQTSNEILDITIGAYHESDTVTGASGYAVDASGKITHNDTVLMLREKVNIYKQYAQLLLGDSSKFFTAPFDSDFADTDNSGNLTNAERIDEAVFINIKRLFTRDGLDKEQLSFQLYESAVASAENTENLYSELAGSNFKLYTDVNAESNLRITTSGGSVGNIVGPDTNSGNANQVGIVFYDKGIIVLDAKKVFNPDQEIHGIIDSISSDATHSNFEFEEGNNLIPHFWRSGSIDNILDHICLTRFGRAQTSALGFINQTSINSTLYFCRVGPNDVNFSTNPTYTDENGSIRCIQDKGDDPFSYITTIGLYNGSDELLAVAKTSRPIEKNPEVDLSINVRIDY